MEISVTLFHVILLNDSGFCENVFCDIPGEAFGIYIYIYIYDVS
jgi:hypothetical protein